MTLSNKKPFIAGNWKMNKTRVEAIEMVGKLCEGIEEITEAEMVIIPPYTAINDIYEIFDETSLIQIGAQNLFWEESGAYTGEISADMLAEAGCRYVVIGHSERRQYFGETNQTVNKKIKAALSQRLTPIICIGESLDERENGKTMTKIESQIYEGLEGFESSDVQKMIFAYEPIWAIGTGLTATPEQAQEVHNFIRNKLVEKYGNETASCAIILYGGSVKPANTFSLLKEKDINGALVGGASLKADSFLEITKEAIKAYKEK